MVKTCLACGFRLENQSGRSSHRIPTKNGVTVKEWADFLGKCSDWVPSPEAGVCGEHFRESCFKRSSSKPTLTTAAYPTIKVPRTPLVPLKLLNGKVQVLEIRNENTDRPIQLTLSSEEHTNQLLQIKKLSDEKRRIINELEVLSAKFNVLLEQNNKLKKDSVRNVELSVEKQMTKKQTSSMCELSNKYMRCPELNRELTSTNDTLHAESFKWQSELERKGGPLILALVKRALNTDSPRYPEIIMKFCKTMFAYSKKSSNVLRESLKNIIPYARTVQRHISTIDVKPGFLSPCLNKMREMSDASEDPRLYCNITLDEIHIRNQILMTRSGEVVAFLDYGTLQFPKYETMATSALFVMAVAVNVNWKLPIAYFLTNGLPCNLFCEVVTESLIRVHETQVHNISVTLDRLQANFSAIEKLGASLTDPGSLKPHFPHPVHGGNVYVFPDPPHMLKLMRNLWTNKAVRGILYDKEDNELKWDCIRQLHDVQKNEGVRAANGLTSNHIDFHNQKMKVSLAAKIYSQSVSKDLLFCRDIGMDEFKHVIPLSQFLDTIDRGFDLLNVCHPKGEGRKAPLRNENKSVWMRTISDMKECLFGLKMFDQEREELVPLLTTPLKTGPLGFLIALNSLESIMKDFICCPSPVLKYLLTYKFSQDHVEIFFSSMRACRGFNNNPNTIQLAGAVRKVLSCSLSPSLAGNCLQLDDTSLAEIRCVRKAFVQSCDLGF